MTNKLSSFDKYLVRQQTDGAERVVRIGIFVVTEGKAQRVKPGGRAFISLALVRGDALAADVSVRGERFDPDAVCTAVVGVQGAGRPVRRNEHQLVKGQIVEGEVLLFQQPAQQRRLIRRGGGAWRSGFFGKNGIWNRGGFHGRVGFSGGGRGGRCGEERRGGRRRRRCILELYRRNRGGAARQNQT